MSLFHVGLRKLSVIVPVNLDANIISHPFEVKGGTKLNNHLDFETFHTFIIPYADSIEELPLERQFPI